MRSCARSPVHRFCSVGRLVTRPRQVGGPRRRLQPPGGEPPGQSPSSGDRGRGERSVATCRPARNTGHSRDNTVTFLCIVGCIPFRLGWSGSPPTGQAGEAPSHGLAGRDRATPYGARGAWHLLRDAPCIAPSDVLQPPGSKSQGKLDPPAKDKPTNGRVRTPPNTCRSIASPMLLNRGRLGIANRHEPGSEELIALNRCQLRVLLNTSGVCREVSGFPACFAVAAYGWTRCLSQSSRNRHGETRDACDANRVMAILV